MILNLAATIASKICISVRSTLLTVNPQRVINIARMRRANFSHSGNTYTNFQKLPIWATLFLSLMLAERELKRNSLFSISICFCKIMQQKRGQNKLGKKKRKDEEQL